MQTLSFSHSIRGYLVGQIWMPAVECFKPLSHDCDAYERRCSEPCTLRDHMLAATHDGDFQSCEAGDAYLETTLTITKGGRTYRRKRHTPLEAFPSIADMVRKDWFPPEEYDA